MSGTQLQGYDASYWVSKDQLLNIALRGLLLGELRVLLFSVPVAPQGRNGVLNLSGVSLSALSFKSGTSFELAVRSDTASLSGLDLRAIPAQTYIVGESGETLTTIGRGFGFTSTTLLAWLHNENPLIATLTTGLDPGVVVNIPHVPAIDPLRGEGIGEVRAFLEVTIGAVGSGRHREVRLTLSAARLDQLSGLLDTAVERVSLDPGPVREEVLASLRRAVSLPFPTGWGVRLPEPLPELCKLAPFSLDLKLLPSGDMSRFADALAFFLNLVPGTQGRKDMFTQSALPSTSDVRLDLATRLVMRLICCALPRSPQLRGLGSPKTETATSCEWLHTGPINLGGTDYHVERLSVSIVAPRIRVEGRLRAGDPSWGWQAWATFTCDIELKVDANGRVVAEVLKPDVDVDFYLEWWVWLIAALLAIALGVIGGLIAGSVIIGVIVGVLFFVVEAIGMLIIQDVAGDVLERTFGSFGVALEQFQLVPDGIIDAFGTIGPRTVEVDDITVTGAAIAPVRNNAAFVGQNVRTSMAVGQSYTVSVTMRNTGNQTWVARGPNPFRLGSQNRQDNTVWGRGRVDLPSSVRPGTTITLSFSVRAPSAAGTYNFQWRMVQEGVEWFGALSPNVPVVVKPPPQLTGISPSSGRQGESKTVWISGVELTGTTSVSFGYDVRASIASVSSSRVEVRVTIGSGAQVGPRRFQLYTPLGVLESGPAGLSFTVERPYGAAFGERGGVDVAVPARVESVVPAELTLAEPPSSILVTFTKPVRWATLTAQNVELVDNEGRSPGVVRIEPYPFSPSPELVSGITLGLQDIRAQLAHGARPLVLTLRLNGSRDAQIQDVDGRSLDGAGNGGAPPSDFLHTYTLTG